MPESIKVKTSRRLEFLNITDKVKKAVNRSGIKEGICRIFVPHTTAGIIINENADPDVMTDLQTAFQTLVPQDVTFLHTEGNSDSHMMSVLAGPSKTIFIENSSLVLGTWQGIFFAEFDGPREREVWIKITSD